MEKLPPETVRALRAATGLSALSVSRYARTTDRSIRRYERFGTDNWKYISCLLDLAQGAVHNLEPVKRGRPKKSWQLIRKLWHSEGRGFKKQSNGWALKDARYWLYRPGHSEHCRAIVAPPSAIGDSWLIRDDAPDTFIRFVHNSAGQQEYVATMHKDVIPE